MADNEQRLDRNFSRHQEVVDVAARVFYEKGFEGATVQDVADALGILKGSLYHYIGTKDDLLWAIAEEMHAAALEHIRATQLLDVSTTAKLREFIRGHVDLMANKQSKIAVFLHDYKSLGPGRLEEIARERLIYLRFLIELIEKGQEEGAFNDTLDPELSALAVIGMLNWMYEWYRPGRWTSESVTELFTQFTLSALTSDASATELEFGLNSNAAST